MKRTLERKIVGEGSTGRFALTLTMADGEWEKVAADDAELDPALAQAVDLLQRVLYPTPVDASQRTHPRDSALFERLADGALVRIRCQVQDVEKISDRYRYLIGAYDDSGRLLPTFWTLPLIDVNVRNEGGQ